MIVNLVDDDNGEAVSASVDAAGGAPDRGEMVLASGKKWTVVSRQWSFGPSWSDPPVVTVRLVLLEE